MKNFLNTIINYKNKELKNRKRMKFRFRKALLNPKFGDIGVIAEIKFASPAKGVLGHKKNLLSRVLEYQKAKADVISIITDKKFFKGNTRFISQTRKRISLPILQKDFVIDPLQIYEAKILGSEAILLIVKIISRKKLKEFVNLAFSLGIEPVVEINDEKDLEKTLKTRTKFIAVNARNLATFKVDLASACQLIKKIPKSFNIIGFSGVKGREEVEKYQESGAKAVLVGTSLMRAKNIKKFIKVLKDES